MEDNNKIKKKLNDFLYEEEGNISRGKILTVGSLLLVAGMFFAGDIWAAHRSHSSHSSHRSHSSGGGGGGDHYSHVSHQSHTSHNSGSYHASHNSHSNSHASHNSHSNTHTSSTHSNVQPAHTNVVPPPKPTFNTPQTPKGIPEL